LPAVYTCYRNIREAGAIKLGGQQIDLVEITTLPVNIFVFFTRSLAQFFELLFYSLLWGASCKKEPEIIPTIPDLDNTSVGKEENRRGSRYTPEPLFFINSDAKFSEKFSVNAQWSFVF
jgi:hypothetical protein